MVETVKKYLLSPVVLSAFFVFLAIYALKIPLRKDAEFSSVAKKESLISISGVITSNPVKNLKIQSYSVNILVKDAVSSDGIIKVHSEADGVVLAKLPAYCVEALYPGKLYSEYSTKASDFPIIEKGESVILEGTWSKTLNAFCVENVKSSEYFGKNLFLQKLWHLRSLSRLYLKRLLYSWGNAGALILSLLSGSREYLLQDVAEKFKLAGLSHILALSGMHLSFFSGLFSFVGNKIFGKKVKSLFSLAGVMFFSWFAGLSPSLLRALLCSLFVLFESLFFIRGNFIKTLCLAFLVHVCIFPLDSLSVAFMLSYAAIFGILMFSKGFEHFFSLFTPKSLSSSLSASCSAVLFTSPISIKIFGMFMPIGIISSTIVSPLINCFLALSLFGIVFSLCIPFLSPLFGCILEVIYKVIVFFVNFFALVPPVKF